MLICGKITSNSKIILEFTSTVVLSVSNTYQVNEIFSLWDFNKLKDILEDYKRSMIKFSENEGDSRSADHPVSNYTKTLKRYISKSVSVPMIIYFENHFFKFQEIFDVWGLAVILSFTLDKWQSQKKGTYLSKFLNNFFLLKLLL